MFIFETDTKLLWYWDGSAFVRVNGRGRIAENERTTDIATSSTTNVIGVQATATVLAGNRPHLVVVEGPGVNNPNGITDLSINRDATLLQAWRQYGDTGATAVEQPPPVFALAFDVPTPGTYNYILNFHASIEFGGTSTLDADTNTPLGIHVIEL